jgi:VIT1/CCC1 family predicted Fe2+/Mn2+ transporter
VESDEFEATMRATRRSSLLGDFLFAVPFLSGHGIGAVAVVLLLALLIFGIVSLGIGLRDRRKPPFPMGDRDG